MNRVISLIWTENRAPCEECTYDHCMTETPFGKFLITWKSWKKHDDYCIDETPWGDWYKACFSLDEAKQECQNAFTAKILMCLEPE